MGNSRVRLPKVNCSNTLRLVCNSVLALILNVCLGTATADAQNASWLLNPESSAWNNPANWAPTTVPIGTATFGASNTTTITFPRFTTIVDTLSFIPGAPAYTFVMSTTGALLINAGIVNNSSNAPTFIATNGDINFSRTADNSIITNGVAGVTSFNGGTAGTATITNINGGQTQFPTFSSTDDASIINTNGGQTIFTGRFASAGNATITNAGGGLTTFEFGTADNATIINNNGGRTIFSGSGAGGNATIITNNGGLTLFSGASSGGSARFITNAGGAVDISGRSPGVLPMTGSVMAAGSIEGAGTYYLGANPFYVGFNNRSTGVTGIIADGGISGGTGGSLIKNGSGTLTLSGINTYTGGTVLNAGALAVNSAQALGFGNVVVNEGILEADSQPINVKGSYTQNASGTLELAVSGASPGQFDRLNVGGNAALGGALQLISARFHPKLGDQLALVTSAGGILSRFTHFVEPFGTGPGFTTVELQYSLHSVALKFVILPFPAPSVVTSVDFASFARTPNQLAAGNVLDQAQFDPAAAKLISFLDNQSFSDLPADLQKITPDGTSPPFTR
jgi:autotransporter-associated beta strand protein